HYPCGCSCICLTVFFLVSAASAADIDTLSLHDALPISRIFCCGHEKMREQLAEDPDCRKMLEKTQDGYGSVSCVVFNFGYLPGRSEEHTSELQSRFDLVCRLLLEKKKQTLALTTQAPMV